MKQSRKQSRSPAPGTIVPGNAGQFPDDHWLMREVGYWESAYDRLSAEFLRTMTDQEGWKKAHDDALQAVRRLEQWSRELEHDRDRYVAWDADKRRVIETLNEVLIRWQSEHAKVVAQVEQWVAWFREVERDRDRYKQWDADKRKAIDTLELELKRWQEEHRKVVAQVEQWVAWFKELEQDRDRYKQWDADKRKAIEALQLEVKEWQAEHRKVVAGLEGEVSDLQDWRKAALEHPLWYLVQFVRHTLRRIHRVP